MCGLLTFVVPFPADDLQLDDHALAKALATAGLPSDAVHVRQLVAELAYGRGDFSLARENFAAAKSEPTAFCAALLAICAAISTGDYGFYREIWAFLERMRDRHPPYALIVDSLHAFVHTSMLVPQNALSWIDRDLVELPEQTRPYAVYLLAKYQQAADDFSALYTGARTTLALQPSDARFRYFDIYFKLMAAAASYGLDNGEACRHYLRLAAEDALPRGFYTPFAELFLCFGGELQRVVGARWPDSYRAIERLWQTTSKNWVAFHNRFAENQVSTLLSKQEIMVAQCLAHGLTYEQTARKVGVSFRSVKNLASSIYNKLGIKGKKELGFFVLW